jgi:hypothetical protein
MCAIACARSHAGLGVSYFDDFLNAEAQVANVADR